MAAAIGLVGCESKPQHEPIASDTFHEQAIYTALKSEPVPLPQRTSYDGDARQREAFDEGFRSGWDRAISGALLHGTFGTPTDVPNELHGAWSAGWKSGAKAGGDRWSAESKRQQATASQTGGAATRDHPAGSETNRMSSAAGPGG